MYETDFALEKPFLQSLQVSPVGVISIQIPTLVIIIIMSVITYKKKLDFACKSCWQK